MNTKILWTVQVVQNFGSVATISQKMSLYSFPKICQMLTIYKLFIMSKVVRVYALLNNL